jgi:hypothetical protein
MSAQLSGAPTVQVLNLLNDATGLARQRCVTMRITGLTEANPEISLTPGQLALVRVDSLLIIPFGSYCEAFWNGDKKQPKIHFNVFPDQDSFDIQVMVWGVQYG